MEEQLKNNVSEGTEDTDTPLDQNVRLMSPTRMVVRRFFRSKLSIVGLIMIVGLFLFSFVGPLIYTQWGEIELDESGFIKLQGGTSLTSMQGVFAAGDCADPRYRQAVIAAGMGAKAAMDAEHYLADAK